MSLPLFSTIVMQAFGNECLISFVILLLFDPPGPLAPTPRGSWRFLGVPGGSFGSPCRDLVPHMLRTPMFQRVLFFVALASLFLLLVALAKLKVTQRNSVNPAEARAHQTLCTAMF